MEATVTTVAIVGAGLMGSATAWPLSDNGHSVRLVGTHLDGEIIASCRKDRFHPRLARTLPERVTPYFVEEMGAALDGVEVIVSGVNSLGAHWIGQAIGPHLKPGQAVIAVTKGLEVGPGGELRILPDVLRSELPAAVQDRVSLCAIGGPCIAGELAGRRPSMVVFGGRDGDVVNRLAALFQTSYYQIWTTTDLVGLEVSAALKNAFTLAVGLAAGLMEKNGGVDEAGAFMYNLAAGVFAEGTVEIAQLLELAGATRAFAYGLPGAGDLYVTCMGGRTVRLGRLLGAGHSYAEARQIMAGETLESVEIVRSMSEALPHFAARGLVGECDLPLLRALIATIVEGREIDLPIDQFFAALAPGVLNKAVA